MINYFTTKAGDYAKRFLGGSFEQSEIEGLDDEEYQEYLVNAIETAHKEWLDARRLFEEAVEQDLIDYAVLAIQAAEKKYMLLIKQAKVIGLGVTTQ